MIPIVGHPHVVLISERKAAKLVRWKKAIWIDGLLHWLQVPRYPQGLVVPRLPFFERNSRDSVVRRWKTAMSAEPGEGGPLVRQAVTNGGKL